MEKQTLKNILNFLEENEEKKHKYKNTFIWKDVFNESLTKEDLVFKGDLYLENLDISGLPEGLQVDGDLNLYSSPIQELPKGLKIRGDLDLYGSDIDKLPEGLKVGGDLYIHATPLTKYLYDDLRQMVKPGFIKGIIYR